ncbi:MAG: hypothetical protein HY329_14540 [Chloroflexi bacterium]|nr:hypothetical protein [Chloroflexota bacterium]
MRIILIPPGGPDAYTPAFAAGLQEKLAAYVRADTTIEVGLLTAGGPSARVAGLTGAELAQVAPLVADRVKQAAAEGCDAAVIYGTFDPGAEPARNLVRIPVVGTGRAGLLVGAALGDRFGVLVYEDSLVPAIAKVIRLYQMERWVASIRAVNIPSIEMQRRTDELRERLIRLSRQAVEQDGAEVIVPMGLSMIPNIVPAHELAAACGVPVVDALIAGVRLAESLVLMKASHSPIAYPPSPL